MKIVLALSEVRIRLCHWSPMNSEVFNSVFEMTQTTTKSNIFRNSICIFWRDAARRIRSALKFKHKHGRYKSAIQYPAHTCRHSSLGKPRASTFPLKLHQDTPWEIVVPTTKMDNFRAQIREATGEISHDRQVLPGVVVIARSGSGAHDTRNHQSW